MYDLNALRLSLKEVNEEIKNKYLKIFSMDKLQFRQLLTEKIGSLVSLKKLDEDELKALGQVVGVDGSSNRIGGAFPHYIDFFQALAMSTDRKQISIFDSQTPILGNYAEGSEQRAMSDLELKSAIEFIEKYGADIVMMDGGFIRYKINSEPLYKQLKELCEDRGVLLFGIIKDIKTSIIAKELNFSAYDREVLYDVLDVGEMLIIRDDMNKKFFMDDEGLSSAFLRTSKFPQAIGIDVLNSQKKELLKLANLTYTLTPINSRGVPLWLDVVDRDVKLTDKLLKNLTEQFFDRDIYERFFVSERKRR